MGVSSSISSCESVTRLELGSSAWYFASDFCSLFSELAVVLEMALGPRMKPLDAEKAALHYAWRGRKLLHEASLNAPMVQDDPDTFHSAMNLFIRRDMGLYAESKEALGIQTMTDAAQILKSSAGRTPGSSPTTPGETTDGSTPYCLRYALQPGMCSYGANGARVHQCPFCDGRTCQHKEAYLARHLDDFKNPTVVVDKRDAQQEQQQRRRSRSRSRGARADAHRRQDCTSNGPGGNQWRGWQQQLPNYQR